MAISVWCARNCSLQHHEEIFGYEALSHYHLGESTFILRAVRYDFKF